MSTHSTTDLHNPDKAVQFSLRACKLTKYQNAVFLNTLAAAYASKGQLEQAIETARQAIELAVSSKQLQLVQEIEIYLKRYQAEFDSP